MTSYHDEISEGLADRSVVRLAVRRALLLLRMMSSCDEIFLHSQGDARPALVVYKHCTIITGEPQLRDTRAIYNYDVQLCFKSRVSVIRDVIWQV